MAKFAKEYRIHVGAHKTATTHFQDTLEQIFLHNTLKNIEYLPREISRAKFNRLTRRNLSPLRFSFLKKQYVKKVFSESFPHSETVLLSEENILGLPVDLLSSKVYQFHNLEFIKYLANYAHIKIYLSIRNFHYVLSGAYVTDLRFQPINAISAKNQFMENLGAADIPSWLPLVDMMQSELPDVEIYIWTQEYYHQNFKEILRKYVPSNDFEIPLIEEPLSTQTPSFDAINTVEKIIANNAISNYPNWREECEKIYSQNPGDNENKFSLFNSEQKALFQRQYQQDLEKIQQQFPDLMLHKLSDLR
ncbi:hypothetical protein [Alteromonas sp. ASW11-130]|uniref:hypothetical protein n=1 Tax=Alteromonas sp. ASW11-130 TaxID=3015775 RepID=UPI002242304A|nr:hypothetical protein [Alteromonas sp. ASW11-130]MCW8091285.1 hypothetical protein [Alteromonas sp. ASW11-130]